jgi:GNAT superfamily N-acetyltransferase
MFESMGMDVSDGSWEEAGCRQVHLRLGKDLGVFVVDHPRQEGRLVASAAGTVAHRLPTPTNSTGLAGYVQWVCTDPAYRGQGLGRRVMRALIDWYEVIGVPTIELHSTPMAEALYRSLGFDDSGPRALRRRRF